MRVLGVGQSLGGSSADGEYARLRRVDDGGKALDAKHAEVRDGERPALELLRLELALPRLGREALHVRGDGAEALVVGAKDYRRDQPVVRAHSYRDVRPVVSELI